MAVAGICWCRVNGCVCVCVCARDLGDNILFRCFSHFWDVAVAHFSTIGPVKGDAGSQKSDSPDLYNL